MMLFKNKRKRDELFREFYNQNKLYFAAIKKHHNEEYYKEILELLGEFKADLNFKQVLDIGSGTGQFLKLLKKRWSWIKAKGVEVSLIGVKMHPVGWGVRADAKNMPFGDNQFDFAFLIDVIEHVTKPKEVLREAIRVIKKGGYLILRSPNYLSPVHLRREYLTAWLKGIYDIFKEGATDLDKAPFLTPSLNSKVFEGGDEDANRAVFAISLKSYLEKYGNVELYKTSTGFGGRVPLVERLNNIPIFQHFGPSCLIVFQKK